MKRILILLVALLACSFARAEQGLFNPTANSIGYPEQGIDSNKASGGGGGATCSFAGSATDDGNNTTRTYSINIGSAAANRLVIVGLGMQTQTPTGVTVNGVTLNQDVIATNANSSGIYSALVTSGSGAQNVVVSGAGVFVEVGVSVWTCTGLSSNVVKHTGSVGTINNAPFNINVTAGDFMVVSVIQGISSASFASSTESPTATHIVDAVGPSISSAEWFTIVSTNASFTVQPSGNSQASVGATYR